MLVELAVRNLGVIPEARIPVGSGLVALTGETGAGKTMVVEALHLLLGGRPDPARVRVGAEEAVVEGLFAVGDTEWVLRRTVPAKGRSRAHVNGELATAATLAEIGATLLELHGQHAQQALLAPRAQRAALDRFAGIDRGPLVAARRRVAACEAALDELGGDDRARARELDLCRFQLDEIERLVASQTEHLHSMRRYAQAARCRHAALSEYFGQTYGTASCNACDVCLGETESLADSTVVAQKILSCVARVGERFGVRHVAEVLRGAKTDGIVRHGHDKLSTFGLLAALDQRAVENLTHQLLDQGLLGRTGGDRPVVTLNERSWEVLKGGRPVVLLEPRSGRAKASKADVDDWQGVDRALFERLRAWRRRVADARDKPAWTIFDDKALRGIAREKPASPAALLRVKGIGEKRLADFGAAILDLVAGKEPAE